MKKFLSLVLALTLVLSLGAVAFASPSAPAYVDGSPVKIDKVLTINNEGTVNPAETFNFTVGTASGLRDGVSIPAPALGNFSITVAQGATTGVANINLPTFTHVGVYTYPITETAGKTAGMRYDGAPYNLVVTVINNPDGDGFLRVLTLTDGNNVKGDAFENEFSAGKLTIKKEVTGNYGDPNDTFTVTVTLTAVDGKDLKAAQAALIAATGGTKDVNEDGSVTITYTVKKGSEFTIENIPYDVDYTVVETVGTDGKTEKGYTVSYDVNSNGKMDEAAIETTITNNRDLEIATGVNLDNLPYILLLVGAVVGLFGFTMKKRLAGNR